MEASDQQDVGVVVHDAVEEVAVHIDVQRLLGVLVEGEHVLAVAGEVAVASDLVVEADEAGQAGAASLLVQLGRVLDRIEGVRRLIDHANEGLCDHANQALADALEGAHESVLAGSHLGLLVEAGDAAREAADDALLSASTVDLELLVEGEVRQRVADDTSHRSGAVDEAVGRCLEEHLSSLGETLAELLCTLDGVLEGLVEEGLDACTDVLEQTDGVAENVDASNELVGVLDALVLVVVDQLVDERVLVHEDVFRDEGIEGKLHVVQVAKNGLERREHGLNGDHSWIGSEHL